MILKSILAGGLSQQCDKVLIKQQKYDHHRLHTPFTQKNQTVVQFQRGKTGEILKTCKQLAKSAKVLSHSR